MQNVPAALSALSLLSCSNVDFAQQIPALFTRENVAKVPFVILPDDGKEKSSRHKISAYLAIFSNAHYIK
jgi:hypothetical protein